MPQDFTSESLGSFRNYYPISVPLNGLRGKPFQCSQDSNLYPTHPSQDKKMYHVYDRAQYSARELDARQEECALSRIRNDHTGRRTMSEGAIERLIARAEETGRRIPCLQGHYIHRVVLSDTYIDACGNYYRGVKRLSFREADENMGTLFSPGRTNYRVSGSQLNERYDGHTYAVPHTDFRALAELLDGDMEAITRGRERARRTHVLDAAGRIFSLRD